MTPLLLELSAFAARADVPADVRALTTQRVLDTVGVALAALTVETSRPAIEHARAQGGAEQARAIGARELMPAPLAAFVNGVLAHSLDYDDTHLPSILHPSASVVPASLAAAEHAGATGAHLISAIAIGLEICVRLGMAGYDPVARDSLYFERGQHATSICGAIASAASAAMLYGLDAEEIAHAMGIAVSMGAGVIEGNRAGGTVKRLHCGIAAQSGVNAAQLAQRGFTGPPTALEGRFGFFRAFLGERARPDAVRQKLGEEWESRRIFVKPYPCNHFTHAGIDASVALKEKIDPNDIEAIELRVATSTVRTIGEPIERKRAPENAYQAQFSGPYTVAAALLGGGGLGLAVEDFEHFADVQYRALMEKVSVVGDAECDAIYPDQFPAVLNVTLKDKSIIEEKVLITRGGPERPLTDTELSGKFQDNAQRVLPADSISAIEDAITTLESIDARDVLAGCVNAKEV